MEESTPTGSSVIITPSAQGSYSQTSGSQDTDAIAQRALETATGAIRQAEKVHEIADELEKKFDKNKIEILSALAVFSAVVAFVVADITLFAQALPITILFILILAQGFVMILILSVSFLFITPERSLDAKKGIMWAIGGLIALMALSLLVDGNYRWYKKNEVEASIDNLIDQRLPASYKKK